MTLPPSFDLARRQLQDAALAELKASAGELLKQVKADQVPIITKAVEDLASLGLDGLVGRKDADTVKREATFVRSTLTSETTLVSLRAEAAALNAVRAIFTRALGMLLTAAVAA